MPTLNDIPMHLRGADKKEYFLDWIGSLPVETWVRRSLMNIWQKLNDVRFSGIDYARVRL